MVPFLKSTATLVPVKLVDATTKAPKTGVASATVTISKNCGAFAAASDGAWAELAGGVYTVSLNATDTGTVGPLMVNVTASGVDPVTELFSVRETTEKQVLTDVGLITAKLPTNKLMGSSDVDNHDTDIDSILADTAEMQGKLPTNKLMGSSDVDNHDTDIDSILADTNEMQGKLPTNYIMGSGVVTDKDDDIDAILVDTADMQPRIVTIDGHVDMDLSDLDAKLDAIQNSVDGISNVTKLSTSLPVYMERPASGSTAIRIRVALKDNQGQMQDPDSNDMGITIFNAAGTVRDGQLYKDAALTIPLDNSINAPPWKKLVKVVAYTGVYECYYKCDYNATEEELTAEFYWTENSLALIEYRFTQIVDAANDFAALLDKIQDVVDKLPADYIMGSSVTESKDDEIDDTATAAYAIQAVTDLFRFTGNDVKATLDGETVLITGTKQSLDSLNDLTAAQVWQRIISTVGASTLSAERIMRLLDACEGGRVSGVGTGTVTIRNSENTKNVVVATVDGIGNRTSIVLDLS